MKVQPRVVCQRAKVDVDRPAESVPTRKALRLNTFDIPKRITDVLEIKPNASIE
jgi:hypothetical protein